MSDFWSSVTGTTVEDANVDDNPLLLLMISVCSPPPFVGDDRADMWRLLLIGFSCRNRNFHGDVELRKKLRQFQRPQESGKTDSESHNMGICSVGVSCSVAIAATRVRIPADAILECFVAALCCWNAFCLFLVVVLVLLVSRCLSIVVQARIPVPTV